MKPRIITGICWSEKYGHHPGTVPLFTLLAVGAIAGGWAGVALMAVLFMPLYLYGAYKRGD